MLFILFDVRNYENLRASAKKQRIVFYQIYFAFVRKRIAVMAGVYAALVTAIIGFLALIVSAIVNEVLKRRYKLWEAGLARCDEQIGKFYAPLSNLVEQLDTTDDIKKDMIIQDPAHAEEISKICYERYFSPIHDHIAAILQNNFHLLEGEKIPASFIRYYKHVASEKVLFSLFDAIKAAKMAGSIAQNGANVTCSPTPYPEPDFKDDINAGFAVVSKRQSEILSALGSAERFFHLKTR